jgi:transglutaminase-like putative cysteine protease
MGRLILDGLWLVVVLTITAAGVWLSSSLAAYLNGPVWLAAVLGLLAFPVLPLFWEARAARRRARQRSPRTPFFTVWDRIVMRTLAVNLVIVGLLLARWPAVSFAALATRGDWFLEGRTSREAAAMRVVLFRTAGGLEWLYRATHGNPYDKLMVRTRTPEGRPEPAPVPIASGAARPVPPDAGGDVGSPAPPPPPAPAVQPSEAPPRLERLADGTPVWPLPAEVHPVVAALSDEAQSSFESVARRIAQAEPDPWMRVKALHDYVALRVSYDVAALQAGQYPPQDPQTVFRTRRAVCAGYANLLAAMGEVTGDAIVVVGGDARTSNVRDLSGEGHAWNAARIGGRWTLLDPTWDAGHLTDGRFVQEYSTEFLFAPPEVQGLSHFPEEERWQLRSPPLSRGEFLRQPLLRPRFFAEGFTLVAPDRPQVTVDRALEAALHNPRGRFVSAHYTRGESTAPTDCDVRQGPEVAVRCDLPEEGTYRVVLFSNRELYGTYRQVGEFEALRGGGR